MSSAAALLARLQEILKGPNRPVVYAPPEMVPTWLPEYAAQLRTAAKAALDAGASPAKVYSLLDAAAAVDLDSLPEDLLAMCVEAGASADMSISGTESLLHFLLNTPYPIPLGQINSSLLTAGMQMQTSDSSSSKPAGGLQMDQQAESLLARLLGLQVWIPAQHSAACGSVTLAELLRRGATPDLTDSAGNTALHMVVACMVSKKHFPDPSVHEQQRTQQLGDDDAGEEEGAFRQQPAAAAASKQQPQQQPSGQLADRDAARAAYAAAAFTALMQAGWDPAAHNDNGYSVSDLILEGLSRYQTELTDLRDPEGVAQTTVALLSQKAPDKGLQQFLDAKVQGVAAVVDALLLMHRLASTSERPRKTRSVLSLVAVWLVLLMACVWWIYGRRH